MGSKARQTQLVHDLKLLLTAQSVSTQQSLCRLLQDKGFDVNQAKISRLLRKLGVLKIKDASGALIYRLPRDPVPPSAHSSLQHLVTDIHMNESLIVIHTSPGSASLIARMLDHHQDELGILGVVAGDDTLFVAPRSVGQIDVVLARVSERLSHVV